MVLNPNELHRIYLILSASGNVGGCEDYISSDGGGVVVDVGCNGFAMLVSRAFCFDESRSIQVGSVLRFLVSACLPFAIATSVLTGQHQSCLGSTLTHSCHKFTSIYILQVVQHAISSLILVSLMSAFSHRCLQWFCLHSPVTVAPLRCKTTSHLVSNAHLVPCILDPVHNYACVQLWVATKGRLGSLSLHTFILYDIHHFI